MKKNIIFILMCTVIISNTSLKLINANELFISKSKEPIMEYKYTLEESKIKRAQFIWKSCMEELRQEGILTNDDIKSINKYLLNEMRSEKFEGSMKKYDKQKKALRPVTIEKMVSDKILNAEKAGRLRDKFNKYDFSNLEK